MRVVDTHVHLDLLPDLPGSLLRARQAGVAAIIAMGRDQQSNRFNLEMAQKHPGFVYPALGIHPFRLASPRLQARLDQELQFIEDNIASAVALGEFGLDYVNEGMGQYQEAQRQAFTGLCHLAGKYSKPVLVHCWGAWEDCFSALEAAGVKKVAFHWFSGPPEVLEQALSQGAVISANPALFQEPPHREAVLLAPLSRLLLETDSPAEYEPGVKTEPAFLPRLAGGVAELKGVTPEEVSRHTTRCAVDFLSLNSGLLSEL